MSQYHDFGLNPQEYASTDIKNIVPIFEVCLNPKCRAVDRLYRHGYRQRYAIVGCIILLIFICRLKCRHCKKAFTILPSFLLRKFQHTVGSIMDFLRDFFKRRYSGVYRQLLYFYRKRFLSNLNLFEMFFRSTGIMDIFPQDLFERAMKVIELIIEEGVEIFNQKFSTRFDKHFMTPNFAN